MTDGDDKLLRRYRELPRDEPPRELDAAILAASRRAVASRPWSKRFAGPVSIAAVLVLAVGVTLNLQREQPGVEMPVESEYGVAQSTAPAEPVSPPAAAAKDSLARAPTPAKPQEKPELRALEKESVAMPPGAAAQPRAPEPAPAPSPSPSPSPLPAPALAANDATVMRDAQVAAPPPSAARAKALTSPAAVEPPPLAAQRSASVASPDPATELERIAKLRTEGRTGEADNALGEFLRKHPDYRIPDSVWDRVKAR